MTSPDLAERTLDIIVDEIFPHRRETIWKTLTSGDLISRWLMPVTGFEASIGKDFTYKTRPAGEWDGTILCRVLEVVQNERLSYSWTGGHEANTDYGAPLDTIVTWTLMPVDQGTRVQLIHAGFVLPRNQNAYTVMGEGWKKVIHSLDEMTEEQFGLKN